MKTVATPVDLHRSESGQIIATPLVNPCPISKLVAEDITTRAIHGHKKYGVTLARTDLDRQDWLQHAYEEALDLACYLRRMIEDEKELKLKDPAATRALR